MIKRRDGACPVFICLTRIIINYSRIFQKTKRQLYTSCTNTPISYARPTDSRCMEGVGRSALNIPHFEQLLYNLQQKRHQIALTPFLILDWIINY